MRRETKDLFHRHPDRAGAMAGPLLVFLPSSVKVTISGTEVKRHGRR